MTGRHNAAEPATPKQPADLYAGYRIIGDSALIRSVVTAASMTRLDAPELVGAMIERVQNRERRRAADKAFRWGHPQLAEWILKDLS